jgi:hypothetical protein
MSAVCPVSGNYELGEPECRFLFPAFKERSNDRERINVFKTDGHAFPLFTKK